MREIQERTMEDSTRVKTEETYHNQVPNILKLKA